MRRSVRSRCESFGSWIPMASELAQEVLDDLRRNFKFSYVNDSVMYPGRLVYYITGSDYEGSSYHRSEVEVFPLDAGVIPLMLRELRFSVRDIDGGRRVPSKSSYGGLITYLKSTYRGR